MPQSGGEFTKWVFPSFSLFSDFPLNQRFFFLRKSKFQQHVPTKRLLTKQKITRIFWFFSFSQSGNLNRHMRVHGTNGNNLITWHQQVSHISTYKMVQSRPSRTANCSLVASVSCAEQFQRLRQNSTLCNNNFVNSL